MSRVRNPIFFTRSSSSEFGSDATGVIPGRGLCFDPLFRLEETLRDFR